jgi:diadenosine tetraphosphate (Ap4A) HIT family hydrolase
VKRPRRGSGTSRRPRRPHPGDGWMRAGGLRDNHPVPETPCAFCQVDASRLFHVGSLVIGLWDAFPVSPGHALLVPRRHVTSWFDATDAERAELAAAVSVARDAILRSHRPEGFNIGVNVGEAAGQTVAHLHVHVIPRHAGDVADPRGGVRGVIPSRRIYLPGGEGLAADSTDRYAASGAIRLADTEPALDEATFAEKVLNLLDKGSFTATYKYAVLLALLDLCLEHAGRDGRAPDRLGTRELAEKVIAIYWPHTVPFAGREVIRQNSRGQAEIVSDIMAFRERHAAGPSSPLARGILAAPERYEALVLKVELKLIEMPLPRLQVLGRSEDPFIYRIAWDRERTITPADVTALDRTLYLRAGAGDHLVRLSGLLRPLIQRQWIRMIGGIRANASLVEDSGIEEFLFGADRIPLDPVRPGLRDLQDDRCFFCEGRLGQRTDVDHFVPWSRYPSNGIENLVVAHPECNSQKKDFLAAAPHVSKWSVRDREHAGDLRAIAERAAWESAGELPLNVARGIYLALRGDALLWLRGKEFVPPDRGAIEGALR